MTCLAIIWLRIPSKITRASLPCPSRSNRIVVDKESVGLLRWVDTISLQLVEQAPMENKEIPHMEEVAVSLVNTHSLMIRTTSRMPSHL